MKKDLLSVIIPSRDPRYLQQTIDDLLIKAVESVEIIVVLDGVWHNPMPKDHPQVRIIHHGTQFDNKGMRESINKGMALAQGEFVMKCDEHVMFDQGFDKKLKADCEDNWLVIPRRKRLDPDKWENIDDERPDIDHMYVEYPYAKSLDKTQGLHGNIWKQRTIDLKDELIPDTPTMQGSCYFLRKSLWDSVIIRLDDENFGPFTAEAQELSLKVWLVGGSVKRNKKTWYSHWYKGRAGRNYNFSTEQYKRHSENMEKGRLHCIDFFVNNKWEQRKHDFSWFINEKFPDMPGWGQDWEERIIKDKAKDYSTLKYKDDFWLQNLRDKN